MALIEVCDRCGGREGIAGYTIAEDEGRKVRVVLCKDHRGVAIELMDLVKEEAPKPAQPRKRASARRATKSSKVVSMKEIEAMS